MNRLISLFNTPDPELRLTGATPPPRPDYTTDPEYFQHLLTFLREESTTEDLSPTPKLEEVSQ